MAIDRGRIVALGRPAPGGHEDERDLGDVAILPGVVNAHTHLELSYLRDQVPPSGDFVTWIRGVVGARRQRPDAKSPEIMDGVDAAIRGIDRVRHGDRGRHQQHAGHVRAPGGERARRRRVLRTDPLRRRGGRAGRRGGGPSTRRAGGDRRRTRRSCGARAVLGGAADVSGHPRGREARSDGAVQRSPVRIGRGSRVHQERHRPVADVPRGGAGVGSRMGPARRQPRAVPRGLRVPRFARAGRPRRADVARGPDAARTRAAPRW